MAALMPPAAATEWERTGWTLLMIATVAPASAAARAARWPARPAPMMRTSCEGMAPGFKGSGWAVHHIRRRPSDRPSRHPAGRGGGEGATHLIDGHDAAQDAVAVDHHQGPEAAQRLRGKQRLERRVVRDLRLAIAGRLEQVGARQRGAPGGGLRLPAVGADGAQQAPDLVDDGEPRRAVAQEELVLGAGERRA